MSLVNPKLDISRSKRITFEDYKIHCSCSFLMAQLKQSWQYWHSCIAESLWKPLLENLQTLSTIEGGHALFTWQSFLFHRKMARVQHQRGYKYQSSNSGLVTQDDNPKMPLSWQSSLSTKFKPWQIINIILKTMAKNTLQNKWKVLTRFLAVLQPRTQKTERQIT